jgi:arylsulfatase A-like enzyme
MTPSAKTRTVLAVACLLVGWAAFRSIAPEVAAAQTQPRPNILIFVTDDQRATNTMWVMPRTRRYFQRGGVRFPNAFATTPLCCPSRATIFTGRYAHNTGVRDNKRAHRLDTTTMFPRLLRRAGYRTALVGKFLNSWGLARRPPHFDRWASGGHPYVDPRFNVNGAVRTVDGYSTTLVGRFARRFLRGFEADDAAPWFLYMALKAPHHPWLPAARHRSRPVGSWPGNPAVFESDRTDKPAFVRRVSRSLAVGRIVRQGQLRLLMSVDDEVGRVFATLRRLGETRRTLAIFTSDNGFLWADHGVGGGPDSGAGKRVPYTASVQIPFFLRWPGHVAAGRRQRRIIGTVDIAPTVLHAAGVATDPKNPPLDGRSLLSGEKRARIVLEYWRGRAVPTWASLRTRRYQYIEYYRDSGRRFFREYYDLKRDPWQLRNLLRDGRPGNNPRLGLLSRRLQRDRKCAGTSGARACP